jgi:hypothetical protein
MTMCLVQYLRESRQRISGEGSWVIGALSVSTIQGNTAYCAVGCLYYGGDLAAYFLRGVDAVYAVLFRRYLRGDLPEPTRGPSHTKPRSWEHMFSTVALVASAADTNHYPLLVEKEKVIAQFNNSTSQAEVLALFDEAIADEEAREVRQESQIVNMTPEVEHASA